LSWVFGIKDFIWLVKVREEERPQVLVFVGLSLVADRTSLIGFSLLKGKSPAPFGIRRGICLSSSGPALR